MTHRVVVAVDDSAPALAAAAAAIELAQLQPTELTFVTVAQSGLDTTPILTHVLHLAAQAGVTAVGISSDDGPAFEAVLAEAHRAPADLIVIGRSDKQRPGAPHVGSQTGHLIEFTDVPVLVVPTPPRHPTTRPTPPEPTPGDTP
jgi:nucleotide-binding universal stress UspA family protein